ncbi:MAG: oligosaccharide flippase family protein, partial [Dysgonamonadaceae bacterium]|nr:oligosaccharide flippase family protein [Dysgonamonadaceae bacterium]
MQSPTLKEKTAKGLYWGSLTSGIQQLISAGFGILLARILTQADYGTIGVLSIFLAVANTLQEGGFTAGLINRKEIKIADYNAVFWFSFGVGASIYLILFFCAPLIAWFFHDPIYIPLSRVMFLWIVAGSLGIAPNAMMQKTLRIKERSIINVTALAVSSITGVVLVLLGYGYWGLVIQSVTQPVVNTTLLWCVSTWRPRWSF